MSRPQVFVSIARPGTPEQLQFKQALLRTLNGKGFDYVCVGDDPEDTHRPHSESFKQICELIGSSNGVVVVAYDKHLARVFEANHLHPVPERRVTFTEKRLSTGWNQAEAAIAYHARVPLMIVCEEGIFREGVLEGHIGANPVEVKIGADAVQTPAFQNTLTSLNADVRAHADAAKLAAARPDEHAPVTLTLGGTLRGLGRLSLNDAILFWGILSGLMLAAFGIGKQWGHGAGHASGPGPNPPAQSAPADTGARR